MAQNSAFNFNDHFNYDQTAIRSNKLKILLINSSQGRTRHTYFLNRAKRLWNDLKKETVSAPTINSLKKEGDSTVHSASNAAPGPPVKKSCQKRLTGGVNGK